MSVPRPCARGNETGQHGTHPEPHGRSLTADSQRMCVLFRRGPLCACVCACVLGVCGTRRTAYCVRASAHAHALAAGSAGSAGPQMLTLGRAARLTLISLPLWAQKHQPRAGPGKRGGFTGAVTRRPNVSCTPVSMLVHTAPTQQGTSHVARSHARAFARPFIPLVLRPAGPHAATPPQSTVALCPRRAETLAG